MTNEELVALIQAGERDRLPELWDQVERFVASRANRLLIAMGPDKAALAGVEFGDLYNSGYFALVDAAERYDPAAGAKFITFFSMRLKSYFSETTGFRLSCKPGEARVTAVAKGARHPYHLIAVKGGGSTVYGWVDAADIAVEASAAIAKGSTVKVKAGAKTYTGGGLASFVYANTYTVLELSGDRAVIGQGKAVTAAVNIKDLTLVG